MTPIVGQMRRGHNNLLFFGELKGERNVYFSGGREHRQPLTLYGYVNI